MVHSFDNGIIVDSPCNSRGIPFRTGFRLGDDIFCSETCRNNLGCLLVSRCHIIIISS